MEEKRYCVTGMTCSACSARVEKAALSVSGVDRATVSLLTSTLIASGSFDEKELFSAVAASGYGIGAETEKKAEKKEKGLILPFVISLILLCVLMCFSMLPMLGIHPVKNLSPLWQAVCQWILATGILVLHRRFFIGGVRAVLGGGANMDTLVSLGSGVSYLYSAATVLFMIGKSAAEQKELLHGLYFESAAMILVLITVGKMLESHAKGKSTSALRGLEALAPGTARVLRDGKEQWIEAEELRLGDECLVYAGERFPADGTVLEGEGAADEAALTGESVPVDKTAGDAVFAGTTSLTGTLRFRVTGCQKETALSRIIRAVTDSAASKAPAARLADRISRIFVPAVCGIAVITAIVHLLLQAPLSVALTRAVTVLVVSCPCALGLATPVSILVGTGFAARHGVLFKSATALEEAGRVKIVAFDKTGTLTRGRMTVSHIFPWETETETLLSVAAALEKGSLHPIARAILERAAEEGISLPEKALARTRAGFGVEADLPQGFALGGKRDWLEKHHALPDELIAEAERVAALGMTAVFFSLEKRPLGLIALQDEEKEEAAAAVSMLHRFGIRTVMISGDSEQAARAVAERIGIEEVYASVLPEEKAALLNSLEEEGSTAMVGDGINDAPALTAAHVGIAIGTGVDIAVDAAEVVVMRGDVTAIPRLIALSRATLRNVKENLFWAFCYNLIGIPLAAGLFVPLLGWSLTPMFGAAAMSLSSFVVVTNALRLSFYPWDKEKKKTKKEKVMEKTIRVSGMMCPHCEAHVKKALEALPQVTLAEPSHQTGTVKLTLSAEISDEVLGATVEKEGYKMA